MKKQVTGKRATPPGSVAESEEIRTGSETHATPAVKRFRITTDVFRNKVKGSGDKAMSVSCGLWNYHLLMS